MTAESQPILVVGGRTTGLMMAAELARHNVPARIIDKSPGIDPRSRATYLHSRTLEILHGLGLADEIYAKGQPLKSFNLYANGKHISSSSEPPVDSPFPWGAAYAQSKTEVILERHLRDLGIDVERNTTLLHCESLADGVRATIKMPDGSQQTITAPWLIGCDGAHSVTRQQIGADFPGEIDPIPYLVADVLIDGPIRPEVAYLCLHDQGDVFIYLLDAGRRQIIATLPKNSTRTDDPTLDEMQQLMDERGFTELRLSDPRWLNLYRTHYRLAPTYRHGRVFLAGDAAHIHSVIGGQGMNMGIQDAHNLAWKLALVEQGVAPTWWLDTYESERREVAADVIAWTKKATEELTIFSELSPAERQRLYEHRAVPECEHLKRREHEEEIDLDYRSSRLCLESEEPVDGGPSAGARCPDAAPLRIAGQATTLVEALSSPRHHLLLFTRSATEACDTELIDKADEAVASHGDWLDVFLIGPVSDQRPLPDGVVPMEDQQGNLRRRLQGDLARLYLIRPDGYVAYRSRRVDSLGTYIERVFG